MIATGGLGVCGAVFLGFPVSLLAVHFAGRMLVGDCDGGFGCLWCGVFGFSCLIVGCAFR